MGIWLEHFLKSGLEPHISYIFFILELYFPAPSRKRFKQLNLPESETTLSVLVPSFDVIQTVE